MTRLGAKKKAHASSPYTWIAFAPSLEPEPAPVYDVWTEEQAKIGCAVTLALMILLEQEPLSEDEDDEVDRKSWYMQCVELACAAPMGSFRNVFWWSLRMFRHSDETFEQVVDYFMWKTKEFDSGRIHREAVW